MILLSRLLNITFTLVIIKISRIVHFFLNALISVIALLGLLLLILEVFYVYFLHTRVLVLLVNDAKLASCLILINISIPRQNAVSLTMLNFNLSSITILIANDLLNLSILKISSLSL
jgi:hypothetical protein